MACLLALIMIMRYRPREDVLGECCFIAVESVLAVDYLGMRKEYQYLTTALS